MKGCLVNTLILLSFAIVSANNPSHLNNRLSYGRVVYAGTAAGEAAAQALPTKPEVLALLKKVNSWQLAHPVMKPDDRNWERGTWYTGVMDAWKSTHDAVFLDQALAWGRLHAWQVGTEPDGANRLFCVETWAELYLAQHDHAMIEPALKWLATPDPLTPAGAKQWYIDNYKANHGFVYVDSLYGASALAMLAKATGDAHYLDIMNAFFDDVTG